MAEKYHAVSIEFEHKACELVTSLEGKRFLSNEAPRLPLCALGSCQCRYRHYEDRREEERRDIALGMLGLNWNYPERRETTRGRRAGDS